MSEIALKPSKRLVFPYVHEAVLAVAVVALFVVIGVEPVAGFFTRLTGIEWYEPYFVLPRTQFDASIAGNLWPLMLLALPMTLIILTGGIDLSVGSTVALCAIVLGLAFEQGWAAPLAIGATLLVGTLAGALNGAIIAGLRVHPLIVTLATMSAFRGIALAVGGSASINLPDGWGRIVRSDWPSLPVPFYVIATLAIVTALFLWRTSYGRFLYAIGHNATAARYSGVPVSAMRLGLFTLSGFCCGLAAILITAQHGQAKADLANGLELEVITAVVLGGVSIFGGRGNIVGVVLGVLLLHVAQQLIIWKHYSERAPLVVGGLLIGSVLINSLVTSRRGRGRG